MPLRPFYFLKWLGFSFYGKALCTAPLSLPLLIEETFPYLQDWIAFLLFCLVCLGGSVVDLDLPRRQRQQSEKLPPQGRGPAHWGERRERPRKPMAYGRGGQTWRIPDPDPPSPPSSLPSSHSPRPSRDLLPPTNIIFPGAAAARPKERSAAIEVDFPFSALLENFPSLFLFTVFPT